MNLLAVFLWGIVKGIVCSVHAGTLAAGRVGVGGGGSMRDLTASHD